MTDRAPATSLNFLTLGKSTSPVILLLAHGAGAPMTSPFFEELSLLISGQGLRVVRFEFSYMAERRHGGSRRPPPKAERLIPEFNAAIDVVRQNLRNGQRLLIGGKSMGGRVASMIAEKHFKAGRVAALLCYGYPFHPPKNPESLRTTHLERITCPTLIVQGEKDPLGTRSEVENYNLSNKIRLHWIAGGDHDLAAVRPRGTSAHSGIAAAASETVRFLNSLPA